MSINPVVRVSQKFDEGNDIGLITSGEDKYIYDSDGKKYLDFCGGIWNMPFGYTNLAINEKIIKQLNKLPFCNLVTNIADIQHNYAVRLCKIIGTGAVLYTCSGSESIEAAIKTCRKYQAIKKSSRKGISAFPLSYHGTTYGAMSVSGIDQVLLEDYFPLLDNIMWIDLPKDLQDEDIWIEVVENHFKKNAENMAGIIIEPIFGSGGIVPIPEKVFKRIQELCSSNDILLVVDEVTTGFGRTGIPFAFQRYGIKPDLICLSKGISNGYLPLGALAFSNRVVETFIEKDATLEHFSTQGGNLISIAAADAVLDLMEHYEDYEVAAKGEYMVNYLKQLLGSYKSISVRGTGLMIGISFPKDLDAERLLDVWAKIRKRGLLVYIFSNPGYNLGLSLFPPFTSTKDDLKKAADKIVSLLKRYPDIVY
ncbi:aspartate aminotransferase family protein [Clostridium saccharobutylicum]|nr:aspartate aminotransferase family protein [Clostridium saccharobutylicum]AQR88637.1 acetylornithine aminotransferase [Clostridium saccharobutylicum]AQR98535.1 acetylornithine aminotransferase [Clostridium saccharobutylicum]AQS08247.1 acetylornithine aminotransferase [Clostridium saccharobutylicum]AQS12525.1 acetylornithine aminotransferase [Clostridium saccharobutylicum]MBA2905543.1 adenosylmethionine-8-amino-7-oxononanoate aminotransferase [Clostridium saccharobutylicum]